MKKGFSFLISALLILMFVFIVNFSVNISKVSAGIPTPTFTPTFTPTVTPMFTQTPLPTATSVSVPDHERPANNSWEVSGEDSAVIVPMNQVVLPAPHDWEVLLSDAIELNLSSIVLLCHPFRGGQFGWTGAIYLKSGSGWLEIPSLTAWLPDEEGRLMICATVSASGTYAVFGYAEPYEMKMEEVVVVTASDLIGLLTASSLPTVLRIME